MTHYSARRPSAPVAQLLTACLSQEIVLYHQDTARRCFARRIPPLCNAKGSLTNF